MRVETFSKAYYLVSGVDVVPCNLKDGENPACSPGLYEALVEMVGDPVIGRSAGSRFEIRPASWVPDDSVVVEKDPLYESPVLLIERRRGRLGWWPLW